MSAITDVLTVIAVVIGIVSCTTGIVMAHRGGRAGLDVGPLTTLLVGASLWCVTSAAAHTQALPDPLPAIAQLAVFPGVGLCVIGLLYLAAQVDGRGWRPGPALRTALVIEPVLATTAAATSGVHHLFYTGDGVARLTDPDGWGFGPLFWVHASWSYLIIAASLVIVVRSAMSSVGTARRIRVTLAVIFAGAWGANVVTVLGVDGGAPLTTLGLGAGGLVMVSLLRRGRLGIVSGVARELIVAQISDPVIVLDPAARIVDANAQGFELLEAIRGAGVRHGSLAPEAIAAGGSDEATSDIVVSTGTGTRRWELSRAPVTDAAGTPIGVVIVGRDVTQAHEELERLWTANQRLAEEVRTAERLKAKLAEQVRRDPLTGMFNRGHLEHELDRMAAAGWRVVVLLLDLDHFKRVNDTYGHLGGDLILQRVAEVLHHVVWRDAVAGRWGGEEFAVLLPHIATSEAMEIAEEIRLACRASPVTIDGEPVSWSVSIGVVGTTELSEPAIVPGAPVPTTRELLMRQADGALYVAKASGRNTVVGWRDARAQGGGRP